VQGGIFGKAKKMEDLKGRDHLQDLSGNGMIILEWILGK
jgi:hypothetical protein